IILHVRDTAHEESQAQKADVLRVLTELGIDTEGDRRILDVLNKLDLLAAPARAALRANNGGGRAAVAISALSGDGLSDLTKRIDQMLEREALTLTLRLTPSDGAGLAWAYAHGRVLDRKDRDTGTELKLS